MRTKIMTMINKIAGCRDLHNATGGSVALFVAFYDWKKFVLESLKKKKTGKKKTPE